MVAEHNVRVTVVDIRKRSPILRKMEEAGQIKIVGGLYDMDSAQVSVLE